MQKMWVVYRDEPNQCRMYFCGVGLDFSSDYGFCACWRDRRMADMAAREIEALYHDRHIAGVGRTFGTVCVDMAEAEPTQYVPA